MNYTSLSDNDKKLYLLEQYHAGGKSFNEIATECGTYANKIRRDAIKYGIEIRNKSLAQKNALDRGKTQHPTSGKSRPDSVKLKIGKAVMESWDKMDDQTLEHRKNQARLNWEKLSNDEKEFRLRQANTAVREASKNGSKLEKYLLSKLLENKYKVEFHKEQSLLNTKLQIDIFLPELDIAIEVDGPSHFEPVWGNDALKRNKKYDTKKTGLILGKGLYLIRIKQTKDYSKSRANLILRDLLNAIDQITTQQQSSKVINIGD